MADERAVLLDAGIVIAAFNPDDAHHATVAGLLTSLMAEYKLVMTEAVWGEALTFLRRRGGLHQAVQAAEALLASPRLRLVHSNRRLFDHAYRLFKRYNGKHPGFSYVDALSVAVMKQEKIRQIASLDTDFDGIRGIRRLASPEDIESRP